MLLNLKNTSDALENAADVAAEKALIELQEDEYAEAGEWSKMTTGQLRDLASNCFEMSVDTDELVAGLADEAFFTGAFIVFFRRAVLRATKG